MKYKIFVFILIFAVSAFFIGISAQNTDIGADDEFVKQPSVLPTSPFYFLKEFWREAQNIFTFNPVAKMQLEIKFANERMNEIKALKEKREKVALKSIEKAIDNYQQNVERLRSRIESFRETSDNNPNVNRLLDELTLRVLRHRQFFDELKVNRTELEEKIEAAQETLSESFGKALEKLDSPEKAEMRFERALKNIENPLKEIEALNVISKVERKIVDEELKNNLLKTEENLISKFEGRIKDGEIALPQLPKLIKDLPKSEEKKLEILDSLRENVSEVALKTQLNIIRQSFLDKISFISKERAREEIEEASRVISEFQSFMTSVDIYLNTTVLQLIEKANFNLKQAQHLFEAGDYGRAFGQATSAKAAARNVLRMLIKSQEKSVEKVDEFKQRLDELKLRAHERGFNPENKPHLFKLFNQTENKIVEILNLVSKKIVSEQEQLNKLLNEVKILLSLIEAIIEEKNIEEKKESIEAQINKTQIRERKKIENIQPKGEKNLKSDSYNLKLQKEE